MCARFLLTVQLALLAATSCTELGVQKLTVWKCCNVHQMLSVDGGSCIEANWPNKSSIKINWLDEVVPPLDSEWVRRWLPPGLPLEDVRKVYISWGYSNDRVTPVYASSSWDPALLEKDFLRTTVAFLGGEFIARPSPGGGLRKADYCVDAAPPPLGPFAMRFRTQCGQEECAKKCCGPSRLLNRDNQGHWKCEDDAQGFWAPYKSLLTVFDAEFPYSHYVYFDNIRLLPFEERYAEWSRISRGIHHFHFTTWDTCFDFYRSSNGRLHEGLFICEHSRITRGVYWLLRPLCFLSTLLLTMSLLSVACNKNLRRKIHGRCLASHAACLLVFNVGQSVYYIAMSDHLDKGGKENIPVDLQAACKNFALSMYFVLTSAWFWLTSLCANMASGFRLHVTHLNKGNGKRFLAISAFAWGLPAVLTITCSILFIQENRSSAQWYTPSLMETRVCYIESLSNYSEPNAEVPFTKSGTALFYYGPVFCLVLCNIVCLVVTLRKVQYLKRGNSVLRREENQIPLGQRHTERNNHSMAHNATGNEQTPQGRNRKGTAVDAKTIKLYIKMILISGGIELLTEVIMWFTTHENFMMPFESSNIYSHVDRDLAYRAAGYVTDFFRAAVVTWLAAPEGGYFGLIMRMMRRGKREKKSHGACNAGRRKHNVA